MEMMAYIISVTHIKCVTSISYSSILQKGKGVDSRNPPPPSPALESRSPDNILNTWDGRLI